MNKLTPPPFWARAVEAQQKVDRGEQLTDEEIRAMIFARYPSRKARRKAKIMTTNHKDVIGAMKVMRVPGTVARTIDESSLRDEYTRAVAEAPVDDVVMMGDPLS